jgi:hypothetical protein
MWHDSHIVKILEQVAVRVGTDRVGQPNRSEMA